MHTSGASIKDGLRSSRATRAFEAQIVLGAACGTYDSMGAIHFIALFLWWVDYARRFLTVRLV